MAVIARTIRTIASAVRRAGGGKDTALPGFESEILDSCELELDPSLAPLGSSPLLFGARMIGPSGCDFIISSAGKFVISLTEDELSISAMRAARLFSVSDAHCSTHSPTSDGDARPL